MTKSAIEVEKKILTKSKKAILMSKRSKIKIPPGLNALLLLKEKNF